MTYLRPSASRYRETPQNEPTPGEVEVVNNAGGYVYQVDKWVQLDRFLILGSANGTYYATEKDLTKQNVAVVEDCIRLDGVRAVNRAVEISVSGRAPRNDQALFVVALAASIGSDETKRAAYAAITQVARIGTHLQHLVSYLDRMRGWGPALKRAVGSWYTSRTPAQLAYQLIKYQERDGWGHDDILRLSHPKTEDVEKNAIMRWATWGDLPAVILPAERVEKADGWSQINGFELLKRQADVKDVPALIRHYRLPRECVPTQFLTDPGVWEALLDDMPMEAMIRSLATMTRVGLVAPLSACSRLVVERLNSDAVRKAKVHPIKVLLALRTYAQGHGMRGNATWEPVPQVIDALDGAFYTAFETVEPTNKRHLLALDVSGSMTSSISGMPLSCREASAAMAMVTARSEKDYTFVGFTSGGSDPWASPAGSRSLGGGYGGHDGISVLSITARQRLDDVVNYTAKLGFGGTDCALPMLWALANKVPVDVFVVLTDSETYAGAIKPFLAIRRYREKMGIPAKLAVVAMTSTGFSLADPNDAGMLDIVGMDSATPELVADFARN